MKCLKIFMLFLLISIPTGCGAGKNIQERTYVLAIGIDYDADDDQFEIYALGIDFSVVAKQEGTKPSEPAPSWIGKSSGRTISAALGNLQKVSQPPLYLRHMKTILLSENVLKHNVKEVLSDIGRRDFFRQSIFLFGAKASFEKIFSTEGLFYFPPIYTYLLKSPNNTEVEAPYFQPIAYREFVARFYEPAGASYIPAMGVDEKSWEEKGKNYRSMKIEGAYFFENQAYAGYKPAGKIKGVRWIEEEKMSNSYSIGSKKTPHTVLRITTSKMKINVLEPRGKPAFSLDVKADAEVLENIRKVSDEKIRADMEKVLKKEIQGAFREGLDMEADVLRLGTRWFRKYKNEFITYRGRGGPTPFYLDENSIRDIHVTVNIRSSFNYKMKTRSSIWDTKSIYTED